MSDAMIMKKALGIYYEDVGAYPDSVDDKGLLKYMVKFPEGFKKNFRYQPTSRDGLEKQSYTITYIGAIGQQKPGAKKKDYTKLMNGAQPQNIPAIFRYIPKQSAFVYVKNPQSLFGLIDSQVDSMSKSIGPDNGKKMKQSIERAFGLKDTSNIRQHLKNEFAVVVTNIDYTSPDIILILSEKDRSALSPTGKAQIVISKDGYIFIASNKSLVEKCTELKPTDSISASDDLKYVWLKK